LDLHILRHHDEQTEKFVCTEEGCNFTSESRGTIARHHFRWHVNGLQRQRGFHERKVFHFLTQRGHNAFNNVRIASDDNQVFSLDILLLFGDFLVIVEVDEYQHRNGYNVEDEIYRMNASSKILEQNCAMNGSLSHANGTLTLKKEQKSIFWIRFNPAPHPFFVGSKKSQLDEESRNNKLHDFLINLVQKEKEQGFFVQYMFYDCDLIDEVWVARSWLAAQNSQQSGLQNTGSVITGLTNDGNVVSGVAQNKRKVASANLDNEQCLYKCRYGCSLRIYQSPQARALHEKKKHDIK
jgi:hypothetical protein